MRDIVDARRRILVCGDGSWHHSIGRARDAGQRREFDRYQGKGIPDGKVSLSLRLTFQSPERTLTDAEVEAATTAVVELLASELGATRR